MSSSSDEYKIMKQMIEKGEVANSEETEYSRPMPGIVGLQNKHRWAMNRIEKAWWEILDALKDAYDLDLSDPNFKDTPKRIAKMMIQERCIGINSQEDCKKLLNKKFTAMSNSKIDESDQLIVTTSPAIVYGICPHHFENVRYKVWSGYVPKDHFIGISKFSRVVELYGRQPILQESFTDGLSRIIMEALEPKGVAIVVKGWHDCMICRGAKSNPEQCMITSSMKGIFVDPNSITLKDEFFRLCEQTGL